MADSNDDNKNKFMDRVKFTVNSFESKGSKNLKASRNLKTLVYAVSLRFDISIDYILYGMGVRAYYHRVKTIDYEFNNWSGMHLYLIAQKYNMSRKEVMDMSIKEIRKEIGNLQKEISEIEL